MLTKHHLFWPKRNYRSPLEKQFRNHSHNIILLEDKEHQERHMTESPPPKPDPHFMRAFLNSHPTNCKCDFTWDEDQIAV